MMKIRILLLKISLPCLISYSLLVYLFLYYKKQQPQVNNVRESKLTNVQYPQETVEGRKPNFWALTSYPRQEPSESIATSIQSPADIANAPPKPPRPFKYNVFKELRSCRFRHFDVWDEEVMEYFDSGAPINCSKSISQPDLVHCSPSGKTFPVELPHCSTGNCDDDFIDDWPMAWKNFSEAGYVTALGEEYPYMSTFNYLMKGFKSPPVHHYMRPFWMTWDKHSENGRIAQRSLEDCILDTPFYETNFKWGDEVIRLNGDQPLFGIFTSGYGHDELEGFAHMDKPLARIVNNLYDDGLFNNSIVVIMGDHGFRFGDYRLDTWMGRQEDLMPFFSVSLPSWFRDKYSDLDEALEWNTNRLTSWYDVYETLMDIVTKNFEQKGHHAEMKRGMSLFKKIPRKRSCRDAGVPLMFCPCLQQIEVSNSSSTIKIAALQVIKQLNKITEKSRDLCTKLEFSYIDSAYAQVEVNEEGQTEKPGPECDLRLIVSAIPSHGFYEANLVYNGMMEQHEVDGIIMRLDRYGEQSKCIKDRILERYCYCRNIM